VFTGLIEEVGTVLRIRTTDRSTQMQVAAPRLASTVAGGASVAVTAHNSGGIKRVTRRKQVLCRGSRDGCVS